MPVADIYRKAGASAAAIQYLGDEHTSALYWIWRLAAMKARGIPLSEGEVFRLKGGNEQLPIAFARRLGSRVRLAHPITAVEQSDAGVTIHYRAYGLPENRTLQADYFVNCISLAVFRNIPVTPALSEAKQYVVDNLTYTSHPFYVFEASSRFWLDDGLKSINMEFGHPDIDSIWEVPSEVHTTRVILKAYGPGGLSPQRVLAAFRQLYPGKRDTIVQALTKDWTQDKLAPSCEMEPFPIGEMHRFWPEILKPEGRIYFAGTWADLLSRGMESCIRSAQRVAHEIQEA
jgi:monoamine oxidase